MNLSYWEYDTWLADVDVTIIGSGIVGLNCALAVQQKNPKAKVLVLEKGIFPQGASTKNAGFACFGSISEILSDLRTHSETELFELVRDRKEGVDALRSLLGDASSLIKGVVVMRCSLFPKWTNLNAAGRKSHTSISC